MNKSIKSILPFSFNFICFPDFLNLKIETKQKCSFLHDLESLITFHAFCFLISFNENFLTRNNKIYVNPL